VTLKFRRTQLRQMASALAHSGRKPDTICSLADLVAVEAAKTILTFFLKRHEQRKSGQIHNFALLLVNIARHGGRSAGGAVGAAAEAAAQGRSRQEGPHRQEPSAADAVR
jgi:hypothetical protein